MATIFELVLIIGGAIVAANAFIQSTNGIGFGIVTAILGLVSLFASIEDLIYLLVIAVVIDVIAVIIHFLFR